MIIDTNNISWTNPKGFIVLEGLNGAGKSTLQRSLAELAQFNSVGTLQTHEPGGSALGKKIRELVLASNSSTPPSAIAELFLFAADRAQHVQTVIKPALEQKQLVICDRYIYSTLAFQGAGRGLDQSMLEQVCSIATTGLIPDLVILLDIDPAQGLVRTKGRNSGDDRFELEELEFHNRLRSCFLNLAKTRPEKFLIIDSSLSKEQVFKMASTVVESLYKAVCSNSPAKWLKNNN